MMKPQLILPIRERVKEIHCVYFRKLLKTYPHLKSVTAVPNRFVQAETEFNKLTLLPSFVIVPQFHPHFDHPLTSFFTVRGKRRLLNCFPRWSIIAYDGSTRFYLLPLSCEEVVAWSKFPEKRDTNLHLRIDGCSFEILCSLWLSRSLHSSKRATTGRGWDEVIDPTLWARSRLTRGVPVSHRSSLTHWCLCSPMFHLVVHTDLWCVGCCVCCSPCCSWIVIPVRRFWILVV